MNNEEKILEMLSQMQTDMTGMKADMTSMKADMTAVKDRLDRVEETQSAMQTTLTEVAITQENIVLPQLKLLAEGHQTLLETLAPKNRVEALEEEFALMRSAFRQLSHEVEELKKAQ